MIDGFRQRRKLQIPRELERRVVRRRHHGDHPAFRRRFLQLSQQCLEEVFIVDTDAVVRCTWVVLQDMELVIYGIEMLVDQCLGTVLPRRIHARHEHRGVTAGLERQRDGRRKQPEAVGRSEETRIRRRDVEVLERSYRTVLHRLEVAEEQVVMEVTAQMEVHLGILPLQMEQIVAPALAVDDHHVGLRQPHRVGRLGEECVLQGGECVVPLHLHLAVGVDIRRLLQALEPELLQQVGRVFHPESILLLLVSLLEHIDGIRHKVVQRLLVGHEGIFYLQRETPYGTTQSDDKKGDVKQENSRQTDAATDRRAS